MRRMSAPGWYVVNVANARTVSHPVAGRWTRLEQPEMPFEQVGIHVRVLEPGQPSTVFHAEDAEESFLVLSGRCLAIVGTEQRELQTWDFLHCQPGVPHTFVGAGEGPCAILSIGARHPDLHSHYPVSELAAAYGASVTTPTDSPAEAYAAWGGGFTDVTPVWPLPEPGTRE